MVKNRINRRQFLVGTLGTVGAGILASCAPEVVKETVIVKETVEVQVETEVEKIVEQTVEVETLVDAAPQLEGRTAVLWGLQYEPHVGAYDRLAALFLGQTGATVAVEPQAWPIETKMIAALAAGTQPDIACIMGKMLLPLQMQDAVLPLMDLVYNHNGVDPSTAFVGDGIGCYTWGGDIWGVPTENNNCGSMVNVLVEEVEALGLADTYPPTNGEHYFESYEAMWDLAAELQTEEDGRVSRWGLTSIGWEDTSLMGIMRTLGADDGMEWWDLENRKFNFDSEIGIEAMRLLVEEPVKLGIETLMDQGSVDSALAGKVALSRGNISPSLQGAEMGYAYRLSGVPKINDKDPLFVGEGGWGFLAPYESENQDVAIDFLRMVCTTAGMKEFA
ncbi:MAG: hypothetical protein MUQ10_17285, partial [Anaerolineae bacterium]|nr:hypothetical protein [Anaerolineae bacterium]